MSTLYGYPLVPVERIDIPRDDRVIYEWDGKIRLNKCPLCDNFKLWLHKDCGQHQEQECNPPSSRS